MKLRLIAPFAFIVLLTIGLLLWFGARLASDERRRVQEELREVYSQRLIELEGRLQATLVRVADEASVAVDTYQLPVDRWARSVARKNRFVRQVFVLDAAHRFVFPNPGVALTMREQDALLRTRSIWSGGVRFGEGVEAAGKLRPTQGWYTWFWDTGLQFLMWYVRPDGVLVCFEVDRTALFAELIATLPETEFDPVEPNADLLVLRDERQREIYRWGAGRTVVGESPYVERALAEPLSSWSIVLFVSDTRLTEGIGTSLQFNLLSGFILLSLVTAVVAVNCFREYRRELREASSRLTFVNQVSHELKTPLTNIRLYAEILEGQLPDENVGARDSLEVIQGECRRLSRLIKNVLTFARRSRSDGRVKPARVAVDDAISSVIAAFRPSLEANGIEPVFKGGVAESVRVDRDVLEQVLGNLIVNAERYAASGGSLRIESLLEKEALVVSVADEGPGIPRDKREFVFQPFCRLSSRLSDGVAGTGIGLTISRDLARRHGGDLVLEETDVGARFVVTLSLDPQRE